MSRRKILMKRKVAQAKRAGKPATVVAPKNMKRKSLWKIIEGPKPLG